MHEWGDEWFRKNAKSFNEAINKLDKGLRDLHILVCGKEKYGCYRTDFFTLWNGSIRYWKGKWNTHINQSLSSSEQLKLKFKIKLDKVLTKINYYTGITKIVQHWQKEEINKLFQTVCKEYPDFIHELICDTDCYMYIKPGKYGDIDGEKIHNKYWKPIEEHLNKI